jgi:YidC/Oxa1 family membrane protein insertase
MLDFVYYPVSAILWFWHTVFGFLLDPASGIAWALSVAFLVFTLRAILFPTAFRQARAQRALLRLQPQIAALKVKHAGDRQGLAVAMQSLQKDNGVSPLSSCLPALLQIPVFLGLLHVLNSFNRTGAPLWMSATGNANTPNYLFSAMDVQSFLQAKLLGAPLAATISSTPAQLAAYGDVSRLDVALVAIPLMLIAAVATHFTARAAVARQSGMADRTTQTAIMNRLMLWVFPVGVLVGGAFLPVAILVYWLSNNVWTLAQQHVVMRTLDREQLPGGARQLPASGSGQGDGASRPPGGRITGDPPEDPIAP